MNPLVSLKSKLEALIYAAEEPIKLDQLASILKAELLTLKETAEPQPGTTAPLFEEVQQDLEDQHREDRKSPAQEGSARDALRNLLRPVLEELIGDYSRAE